MFCTLSRLSHPPFVPLPPPPQHTHSRPPLPRYTIAELQSHKISSMPWLSWEVGTKAAQAQELAEWLYWYQITWPNMRRQAGVRVEDPASLLY